MSDSRGDTRLPGGWEISTDPARLDRDLVHAVLRASSWARGIPRDTLERAIANSLVSASMRPTARRPASRAW